MTRPPSVPQSKRGWGGTKKVIAFAAALACLLLTVSSPDALCVKASRANVRSGPGTHYEQIWEVYRFMPFEKIGTSVSGDWYALKDVDGDIGWMHKRLLTSSGLCAVARKASVRVRRGPGTRYAETTWSPVPQYYSFKVVSQKGSWVKVRDEWGQTGWVYRPLLWVK